jgi:hypothetical protein
MKKYVLSYLFLFVFIITHGQTTQDSVAIIQLLEREAATCRSGDVKAHADCWQMVQNPNK